MILELLLAAFAVGFLGSMHCVGMCGGLITSLSMSRPNVWWAGLFSYQAGRIATYTCLGLMVGMLGVAANQIPVFSEAQYVLTMLAGILMIIFGLNLAGWLADPFVRSLAKITDIIGLKHWIYTASTSRMPMSWLMVGLFNGLLPCGLVYAGLALSLTSGSVSTSAAMMFSFGLGTVPAMMFVPIILRTASPATRGWVLKAAAVLLIAMGVLTMLRGGEWMHSLHHHTTQHHTTQHHMTTDSDMDMSNMEMFDSTILEDDQ